MQHDSAQPAATPPIDRAEIDSNALKVLRRLVRHDHSAYLVGGCVRDLLLGLHPKDFDIATSAHPQQVRRLFRNSRIIGRRFRLVHIHFGPRVIEVSTFRAPPVTDEDDPYIRRDNVFGTEEQDAQRRDFTINALFYDVGRGMVIDHVEGLPDLRAGLLRTIGEAELRLREDPVRILRAAKFAGRLRFELTPDLHEAARAHCVDLRKASAARMLEELYRLLSNAGSARAFRILEELGALEVILPEITPLPEDFDPVLGRLEKQSGGSRAGVTQSLMVAVLCWPLVGPALAEGGLRDVDAIVQAMIQPLGERLTIARRDLIRARLALAAQLRLATPPRGRSAKRLSRREFFEEALRLRRIVGPLDDGGEEALTAWLELTRRMDSGADPAPRRRRRRRRRRGRPGPALSAHANEGKDGACPSPSASSSAPAPPTPPKESPPASSSEGSSPA